ncbi:MAG: Spermine synthase [Candidatus Saccharibacteria bacterium]|nr:Spermine synthase [Candidatus Saccharibacteria bacterium]
MSLTHHILYDVTTAFDHYQVVETIYRGRPSRVLFSSDTEAAQSGVALDDNPELLFEYVQRFLELGVNLQPARSLLIGGGAMTLPKGLHRDLGDFSLDVLEPDDVLLEIATKYFSFEEWPGFHCFLTDGRQFLQETDARYDLIVIDAFSDLAVPHDLKTAEAVKAFADHLTDDGVIAMNVIGSLRGRGALAVTNLIAGFQTAFDNIGLFPAENLQDDWQNQNYLLLASRSQKELRPLMRYAPIDLSDVEIGPPLHDVV